jgi:hypothetical protein
MINMGITKRVEFIPDWHGVDKAVEFQTSVLSDFDRPNYGRVGIFHEAIPGGGSNHRYRSLCRRFSNGTIGLLEFADELDLESHWGPSHSYLDLFSVAKQKGWNIHPLDKSFNFRQRLAHGYYELLESFDDRSISLAVSMSRLEDLNKQLIGRREKHFAGSAFTSPYDTTVVITHQAHIDGIGEILRVPCNIHAVKKKDAEEFSALEDELQLKRAKIFRLEMLRTGASLEVIPIVPIVSEAFNRVAGLE